jgi:hypothetical protein
MNTVAVATSVLTNALIGGKRYEMLSSRAWRCDWWLVIAVLDWIFGDLHCYDCYHFERDNFDGIQD